MAKNKATSTPSSNDPTVVQVTPNSYLKIVWARASDQTSREDDHQSPKVAEFSAEMYIDGIRFQTMNKLCILNTHSRDTNDPVVQIGSMYQDVGRDQNRIYSNTFLPGSNSDQGQEDLRADLVERIVPAVQAFIEISKAKMQERQQQRGTLNPALKGLAEVGAQMRTLVTRRA